MRFVHVINRLLSAPYLSTKVFKINKLSLIFKVDRTKQESPAEPDFFSTYLLITAGLSSQHTPIHDTFGAVNLRNRAVLSVTWSCFQ